MISLRSEVAKKTLQYFILNSRARRYVNELAKLLDVDPKNLHTKLLEFERAGLLKSEFQGRERYFFLNKKFWKQSKKQRQRQQKRRERQPP